MNHLISSKWTQWTATRGQTNIIRLSRVLHSQLGGVERFKRLNQGKNKSLSWLSCELQTRPNDQRWKYRSCITIKLARKTFTFFSPATAVFFYVHHIFYRIFTSQVYILNAILLMLIVLHVTVHCWVMCNRYISRKDTFNSSFAFNQWTS